MILEENNVTTVVKGHSSFLINFMKTYILKNLIMSREHEKRNKILGKLTLRDRGSARNGAKN